MKSLGIAVSVFVFGVVVGLFARPHQMMNLGEGKWIVYNRLSGNVEFFGSNNVIIPFEQRD